MSDPLYYHPSYITIHTHPSKCVVDLCRNSFDHDDAAMAPTCMRSPAEEDETDPLDQLASRVHVGGIFDDIADACSAMAEDQHPYGVGDVENGDEVHDCRVKGHDAKRGIVRPTTDELDDVSADDDLSAFLCGMWDDVSASEEADDEETMSEDRHPYGVGEVENDADVLDSGVEDHDANEADNGGHVVGPSKRVRKFSPREKVYYNPEENDVLLGRGGRANQHNRTYYKPYMLEAQAKYKDLETIQAKIEFVKQTVLIYQAQHIGGLFLEKEEGVDRWYKVPFKEACRKVSQFLRDNHSDEARKAKRSKHQRTIIALTKNKGKAIKKQGC